MKILSLVLPLTAISAVCAALLACVNSITRGPIANLAVLKANSAARAVLTEGANHVVPRPDPADSNAVVFVAYASEGSKTPLGYASPGVAPGYGGDIRIMAGFSKDLSIVTYSVLSAQETPGLGSKLAEPKFIALFKGKSRSVKVTKDGGEIESITGATITSRAVCRAIADAAARIDRVEGRASAAAEAPKVNEGKMVLDPASESTARRFLPKNVASVKVHKSAVSRFPVFEGLDASGATLGFAATGTGTGSGPEGEIAVHYVYGFSPEGRLSFKFRPMPANVLQISAADMISAQMKAVNAAQKNAEEAVKPFVR